ncbi:hypothetical protein [Aldersonia kunmingensis]|uniref:hypothetical protein n=1 Tax=Aldersonia kunmingensis TaxID=408066 RepID=UPI00082AB87A|nr:hypothetical protein [Aldersonia kunmingensis]
MRALLVAGSLAAFTLLGSGLAQADIVIPIPGGGSSIPTPGGSFGSSGLEVGSGPTGSALGSDSLGSTSAPPAGSSLFPSRAELADRVVAELFNLPS